MDDNEATNESPDQEIPSSPSAHPNFVEPGNQPDDLIPDTRLYVPDHEEWQIHIKRDSERVFCYSKHPGEDWFHLILSGEIYLQRQDEKYCIRCALRLGFLTEDRLFWQHRVPKNRNRL